MGQGLLHKCEDRISDPHPSCESQTRQKDGNRNTGYRSNPGAYGQLVQQSGPTWAQEERPYFKVRWTVIEDDA